MLADAGGAMRVVTKTIPKIAVNEGSLTVALVARKGETLISGLEIIREGLAMHPLPSPARVPGRH